MLKNTVLTCVAIATLAVPLRAVADEREEFQQAVQLFYQAMTSGRHQEAERHAARMLTLAERVDPGQRPWLMLLVAGLRKDQGRFDDAAAIYQQLIRHFQAGEDWKGVLRSQIGLAELYQRQQQYDRAEHLFREVMQGARRHDVPSEFALGATMLAECYEAQLKYDEAAEWFRQGMREEERIHGADSADVGDTMQRLAKAVSKQGKTDEAIVLYRKAVAILRKQLGPEDIQVGMCLCNMGSALQPQHPQDAEVALREALPILEDAGGPNHPAVAVTLSNLGQVERDLRRFDEAEGHLSRAVEILRQLDANAERLATAMGNLAGVFYDQRRFGEAEPIYREALEIQKQSHPGAHPLVALAEYTLGVTCKNQGRYDEADSLYQQALAAYREVYGDENEHVALVLNTLGTLRFAQGRPEESEKYLRQALDMREKLEGPDGINVATPLTNLGANYLDLKDYAAAEPLLARAVAVLKKQGAASTALAEDLHGVALWNLGQREAAVEALERSLMQLDQERSHASGAEQERAEYFAEFGDAYERMVHWQRELGNVEQAFRAAERSRARTLMDQMASAHVDLLQGLPVTEANRLRQQEEAAAARVKRIEQQLSAEPATGSPQQRSTRRAQLESGLGVARQQLVEAYAAIRNASPVYRQTVGRDFQPIDMPTLREWVREHHALVLHYTLGSQASYVFAMDGAGEARIEVPTVNAEQAKALEIEAGPLTLETAHAAIVGADGKGGLLGLLANAEQSGEAGDRLAALWQVLVPEATRQALVDGSIERLVIVPDGPLALLPFEALVVEPGESPKYLLDVGPAVSYAPSATLLWNLSQARDKGTAERTVLTVGDPAYGRAETTAGARGTGHRARSRYVAGGAELSRLPYSGLESKWVTEVFKKQGFAVNRLAEAAATEAQVRKGVQGSEVIHLACHGLADETHGNFFGALALAPERRSQDAANDGFLTLAEICQLDLRGCELAVLSACETNYGRTQRGEGVWALTRGFLVAGARRVVASNWRVDDEAAATLISVFSSAVAKERATESGQADYAKALQVAKQRVRKDTRWASPYYWATFVLIGPG
jgi:CHAT domain-containing protein/Tfp pilus assembly protein PilF